jgi:hypothetical protein
MDANALWGRALWGRGIWALVALSGALLALAWGSADVPAAGNCDRFAATDGSDLDAGTLAQPFATAQRLADSLRAGDTGCLRGGDYYGGMEVWRAGRLGAPITITSYPGERATIMGRVWIEDSADFVTVSWLGLDGRNPARLPSPAISGDDVTFSDDEITNRGGASCFDLGPTTYGRAWRTSIERNRIHDCGTLPATNFDHGIYVEHSTAARILDNQVWDNANRGIQLYPDAQETYVARNVVDGNGEGLLLGGGSEEYGPQSSNDNLIELNLITNSMLRNNVETYWGSALVGRRNLVRQNCIFGGALDATNHGLAATAGFSVDGNVLADPLYLDRAGKDFRLRSNSPCLELDDRVASGSAPRSFPRTSRGGLRVLLTSLTRTLRPGTALRLVGQVDGGNGSARVTITVHAWDRWRPLERLWTRTDGLFSTRLCLCRSRLRPGSHRDRRSLRLRNMRLPQSAKRLRLRASARGIGRSAIVSIRIG